MSARAISAELVAAASRDLAEVAAALARPDEDEWQRLLTLVVLARAARAADEATFALLEEHARATRQNLLEYPYRVSRIERR